MFHGFSQIFPCERKLGEEFLRESLFLIHSHPCSVIFFHVFPIAISWQFPARQDELAEEQQTGEAAWSEIFTTPFFRTLSEAVAVVVAACNGDLPRNIGDFMGYDHMTSSI